jgi:hypothetical protein
MHWSYDSLWQKAKTYAGRSMRERRDSDLFPFWCSLTLEFLARATLARVHPSLLADPRGEQSVLYAFGLPAERPVSVPMNTVLTRCAAFIPELAGAPVKAATTLIERRNAELHTGEPAFADLPTGIWLADFLRVCDLLLGHQGNDLESLFGPDEARVARQMLAESDEAIRTDALSRRGRAAHAFQQLSEPKQDAQRTTGTAEARRRAVPRSQLMECPACGALALVTGQLVAESPPQLDGDDIVQAETLLTTRLHCFCCGLELPSNGALQAFGLGGQFRAEWRTDALDYYSAQIDPADFYEPDYGND